MAAPTTVTLDPASGPSGTDVVISGTGFTDVLGVKFGSNYVGTNWSVIDETCIVALVPEGSGTVSVQVQNADGWGGSAQFTYDANEGGGGGGGGSAPTVTDIDPSTSTDPNGPNEGGDDVTVTGTGFTTAWQVLFGGVPAEFTVNTGSDTVLHATAPPGWGSVDVQVFNIYGYGTCAEQFTYPVGSVPVFTSMVPTIGVAGTSVVVTGTNLLSVSQVTLQRSNGGDTTIYDAQFDVISDTSLEFWVPERTDTGAICNVILHNEAGACSDPGSANNFTYAGSQGPITTATNLSANPYDDWTQGPVTVTFSAVDYGGPGIEATYYRVDGGAHQQYTAGIEFSVDDEGAGCHMVEYWSISLNGRIEGVKVGFVNLLSASTVPTGLSLTPGIGFIFAKWTYVVTSRPVSYKVYIGSSNPPTTLYATVGANVLSIKRAKSDGLTYVAISSVDVEGNESSKCTAVSTTALGSAGDLADGEIEAHHLATDIKPPILVSSLPALPDSDFPANSYVVLTTDDMLYTTKTGLVGGGAPNYSWVKIVNTTDLDGTIDLGGDTVTGQLPYNRSGDYAYLGYMDCEFRVQEARDGLRSGINSPLTTEMFDLSLKGRNATASAGFAYSAGVSGWGGSGTLNSPYYVQLDGTDDWFYTGTFAGGSSGGSFVAEAWVRWDGGNDTQRCILNHGYTSTDGWDLWISTGGVLSARVHRVGTYQTFSGPTLTEGTWTHVAFRLDNTAETGTGRWYKNGVDQGATTIDAQGVNASSSRRLIIGTYNQQEMYCAPVSFLIVRLYYAPISTTTILQNYNAGYVRNRVSTFQVTADFIAANSIETGHLTALCVEAGNIASHTITAGQIAAGAIGATEIAARSITTETMVVALYDNLVPNPTSEADISAAKAGAVETVCVYEGSSSLHYYNGTHSRRVEGNGDSVSKILTDYIPVQEGEEYYMSAYHRVTNAEGSGARVYCAIYDKDKVAFSWPATTYSTSTSWGKHDYSFAVPDGGVWMRFCLQLNGLAAGHYGYFDDLFLRRRNEGSLIVDGTITATKLAAGTITASSACITSLNADWITTGSMSASRITTGTMSCDRLSGGTIDAQTISGGTISSATITGGTVRTASSGQRVQLSSSAFEAVALYTGATGETAPGKLMVDSIAHGALSVVSPCFGGSISRIDLEDTSISISATDVFIDGDASCAGTFSPIQLIPSSDWESGTSADGIWIQDMAGGNLKIYYDSTDHRLVVRKDGSTYAIFNRDSGNF